MESSKNQVSYDDPVYAKFKNVLKGAEQGKVITRFPPEPSGYLHIGHVKAAMLNYHYAKMYGGSMVLRFDDTNPMNEKIEFVENIIRDLKTLEIHPDRITHTSDYFDVTKEQMENLIKSGFAYADDTPSEEMKAQRDLGTESKYRNESVEVNLKRFHLMLEGKHDEENPKEEEKKQGQQPGAAKGAKGGKKDGKKEEEKKTQQEDTQTADATTTAESGQMEAAKPKEVVFQQAPGDWCIRAKLDMQHLVKCLRDPVFYRVKLTPHHRTGSKYKAYPTYDFACPIVDSIEGITHCLRSIEYHDRNYLYTWVQEKLGIRKVQIYDFSRLNMVATILSKRNLKWFVEENIADGWYDPRFPTVQGIMRRGMTVDALKLFMLEQGPSKNTNLQEWDKIWAMNKDAIDKVAPRYTAIKKENACQLIIENGPETTEAQSHPLHPKDAAIGSKAVLYSKVVLIEKEDAQTIQEGEKITLMKWGNVTITKKEVDPESQKITLHGKVDVNDKDFKGTKKLTWLIADPEVTIDMDVFEFDHLITKRKLEENEELKDFVNRNSKVQYTLVGEGVMKNLPKGTVIQIERRGYFYVDEVAFGEKKLRLHFVPDGKTKQVSVLSTEVDKAKTSKSETDGSVNNAQKKADAKKAQQELAKQQQQKKKEDGDSGATDSQPAADGEGEEKKVSKKEAKKAAKKESKKKGKEEGGSGAQKHEHGHGHGHAAHGHSSVPSTAASTHDTDKKQDGGDSVGGATQ